MGLGLPVVTTDEGQRGLLVRDGQGETDGVGLGNDPGSLAAAVSKLHTDLDLWATMSAVAHGSVRNVYACAAYDDHLRRVLTDGVTRRNNRLLLSGQTGADPIASPSRPGA
jgi:glycosyltransferase involved in cell wall biosynthesis